MASWEDYKGMQVPDAPTGDAGVNLKDNFDELADRAGPVHEAAADPTADDDQNDTAGNGNFYVWSKWRNTSNNKVFVCVDPSTGAAVWVEITKAASGSNTEVQFNDNGELGGDSNFTFDKSTDTLIISGAAQVDNLKLDGNTLSSIDTNGNIALTPDGSGKVVLDGLSWPTADGSANQVLETDGAGNLSFATVSGSSALPRGYIDGLILSNNSGDADHDIDVSAGACRDSGDDTDLELTSTLTKQIDASWSAGNNAGGLFSGTVAGDTWYHVFLIRKDSDGSIDAGFDTSVTAANIPSGYSDYRRLGSVLTDSSSNILAFTQFGDHFIWAEAIQDYIGLIGTTASLKTLSVPSDVRVLARFYPPMKTGNAKHVLFTSPVQTDVAVTQPYDTLPAAHVVANYNPRVPMVKLWTNTSSQVRLRADGNQNVAINTESWFDPRGKS